MSELKLSNAQIKKLNDWCIEAQKKLLLNHWDIKLFFDEKLPSLMEIRNNVDYTRASILIDVKRCLEEWKEFGDYEMKKHCYHEVVHILLARMDYCAQARWCTDSEWKEAHESTTALLTKILI